MSKDRVFVLLFSTIAIIIKSNFFNQLTAFDVYTRQCLILATHTVMDFRN